ncbi:hypothetical protein IEQ34_019781 [Dendrobium chrysotoxum]|uniref:Uncharacterized protein n=1 Tax=Dendrobium chrysotoxum TaxID=161865 RepID=A0AAV7G9P3_DENCH|nr:hypothetical protein IEQ34_019781 [Dendrobium chrysotoxum]
MPLLTSSSRSSVARILVELDVTKQFLDKVWIGPENLGYIQSIVMEDFSSYCSHYKLLVHLKQECSILHPFIPPTINPISVYGAKKIANDVHENVPGDLSVDLYVH